MTGRLRRALNPAPVGLRVPRGFLAPASRLVTPRPPRMRPALPPHRIVASAVVHEWMRREPEHVGSMFSTAHSSCAPIMPMCRRPIERVQAVRRETAALHSLHGNPPVHNLRDEHADTLDLRSSGALRFLPPGRPVEQIVRPDLGRDRRRRPLDKRSIRQECIERATDRSSTAADSAQPVRLFGWSRPTAWRIARMRAAAHSTRLGQGARSCHQS